MNIEIIKGKTHAHPAILRPKKEKSPKAAINVEIVTNHTTAGIFDLLICWKLTLIILMVTMQSNAEMVIHGLF
jgi:hypothetical protein